MITYKLWLNVVKLAYLIKFLKN